MTFRSPPNPPEDSLGLHAIEPGEIEKLARDHGAAVTRSTSENLTGPTGVIRWTQLLIRLPDDGTGALPLLRHIILNDNKSSTYKLALLRTLCRIADGYLGMVLVSFGLSAIPVVSAAAGHCELLAGLTDDEGSMPFPHRKMSHGSSRPLLFYRTISSIFIAISHCGRTFALQLRIYRQKEHFAPRNPDA